MDKGRKSSGFGFIVGYRYIRIRLICQARIRAIRRGTRRPEMRFPEACPATLLGKNLAGCILFTWMLASNYRKLTTLAIQPQWLVRLSSVGLHRVAVRLLRTRCRIAFSPHRTHAGRGHDTSCSLRGKIDQYRANDSLGMIFASRKIPAVRMHTIATPGPPRYLNRFTLVCGSTGAKSLQSQFGWLHGATRSFPDQGWIPTTCPQRHSFFLFSAMTRYPGSS